MATPPTASAASDVTPALKVVKNERRSGEEGDSLLMCDPFLFASFVDPKTANMLPPFALFNCEKRVTIAKKPQ
jgi:hypothetical protein